LTEAPANAIGTADLALKAREAEVKVLKAEFKSRGVITGDGERAATSKEVNDRHLRERAG
jgi:hypothetical protein